MSNNFLKKNFYDIITIKDALDALYGPMKTSFVKSDDPFELVYNKKGYKLALLIDNSPAFKFTIEKFILSTINNSFSLEIR